MIEKILDLENQVVMVEKFEELNVDQLIKIREEVRLISNRTPKYCVTTEGPPPHFFREDEEISGFDALWASVNIAIAGKEADEKDYHSRDFDSDDIDTTSYDSCEYYDDDSSCYDDDSSYSESILDRHGEEGWESEDGHFFPDSWHPGD